MYAYEQTLKNRYRLDKNKVSIEMKLHSPHQLFDERDPAPFRDKDLDDDAADYILSSLREIPKTKPAKLCLYFDNMTEFSGSPEVIRKAIQNHFLYEEVQKQLQLRVIFRQGFSSLAVGLFFLFLYIVFAHGIKSEAPEMWVSFVKEGLNLMGWVSMWRPIDIFLNQWRPIQDARRLMVRAAHLDVEVRKASEFEVREQAPMKAPAIANLSAVVK